MDNLPQSPGFYDLRLPGMTWLYSLHIPPGFGRKALPLALALHWAGPNAPYTGRGLLEILMVPALGDLPLIIAAPDRAVSTWHSPEGMDQAFRLLDFLGQQPGIDPQRTLLTGCRFSVSVLQPSQYQLIRLP